MEKTILIEQTVSVDNKNNLDQKHYQLIMKKQLQPKNSIKTVTIENERTISIKKYQVKLK
jgi:hypothetical protein